MRSGARLVLDKIVLAAWGDKVVALQLKRA